MATTSPEDLAAMLMQIAHAIDMVNHLPDPASWSTEQLASFPISDNELRLLKHGANESWAINARLLAQFFLGDRHGLDARDFLDSWQGVAVDDLGGWRSTASEHVAHLSRADSSILFGPLVRASATGLQWPSMERRADSAMSYLRRP